MAMSWGRAGLTRSVCSLAGLALAAVPALGRAAPPQATLPSDMPAAFAPKTDSFDYIKRDEMIPMRDGVKLHTVIIIPKGAIRAPILLDRTPYSASEETSRAQSAHMTSILPSTYDVLAPAGYIVVFQDVRGKYGSEGEYVNERPLRGPLNPTNIDHATDAYDTIDWLVKHTPESNGRVGMIGTSYDGMMVLMALAAPHPALKAAVPINPVGDTWMNDDDFHGGAFRLIGYDYYYSQDTARGGGDDLWRAAYDDYDTFLRAGSAGDFTKEYGLTSLGFVQKLAAHPAYDDFWKAQALDKILGKIPVAVPTLFVAGQWDQEDMYGAVAVYEARKALDPGHLDHLVLGPWYHGQANGDGSAIGAIKFDGDTAAWFRRNILLPFLDAHLKDPDPKTSAPVADIAPVTAYETGANVWRRYETWPLADVKPTPIYLAPDAALAFARPPRERADYAEYVSDPAKPVPYRLRPIRPTYSAGSTWSVWLADDQRNFSDRPDVLTFETAPLAEPVHIAGAPGVNLFAATTGTDADWVVKLIDVYPDEVAHTPTLGGYQLMIAADIFRGRYREGFEKAVPIKPDAVEPYRWALPNVDHVFLPGHRIMVQVQSSWFPLYDRNPQTFVPNIFWAKPSDYKKETMRIYDAGPDASFISLPVVEGPSSK